MLLNADKGMRTSFMKLPNITTLQYWVGAFIKLFTPRESPQWCPEEEEGSLAASAAVVVVQQQLVLLSR